jgi:hypothetical protein
MLQWRVERILIVAVIVCTRARLSHSSAGVPHLQHPLVDVDIVDTGYWIRTETVLSEENDDRDCAMSVRRPVIF